MELEERIRQALTAPYAGDEVLMVVFGLKLEGHERQEVYRLLERMWRRAEGRNDTHASEALAHAMSVVAGHCLPEQRLWDGLLELDPDGDAPPPVMDPGFEV